MHVHIMGRSSYKGHIISLVFQNAGLLQMLPEENLFGFTKKEEKKRGENCQ